MENPKNILPSIALTYAERRNFTEGEQQFNKHFKNNTETKEITLENLARKIGRSVDGQTAANFIDNACLPPVNQCVSEAIHSFKKCVDVLGFDESEDNSTRWFYKNVTKMAKTA